MRRREVLAGLLSMATMGSALLASEPEDYKRTLAQVHITSQCGALDLPHTANAFGRCGVVDLCYTQPYQGQEKLAPTKVICRIQAMTGPGYAGNVPYMFAWRDKPVERVVLQLMGGTYTFIKPKLVSGSTYLWLEKHGSFRDIVFTAESVEIAAPGNK